MVRFLKGICRFVYGELTEPATVLEPLRKELKQAVEPLKGQEDFRELGEICLEVSCCGQEFGFISGFKYGITFMIEYMEWPGREQCPGCVQEGCDCMTVDKNGRPLPPGIRQWANGKCEGWVKVDYQSHSVYGDTITEVEKRMTELRYKLEHGDFVASSKVTVEEWFKTWMEQYEVNQVKTGMVIVYNNCYNRYVEDALGAKKLTEIRGEHIQKLYNDVTKKGFSHTTIRLVSATLSGCFKQAMENGLIECNSIPLATLSEAKPKGGHRVLIKEEQDIFIRYTEDNYLCNLFAPTVRTGLKGGKLQRLELSDTNKAAGLLYIQRALKYVTGRGFFEDTPKMAVPKRDIPLTKDMITILGRRKQLYGEKVLKMDGYILHLPDGSPVSEKRVQNEIDHVVKRINTDSIMFERLIPHCLRHTLAIGAVENGMEPRTLKTILGHANLSMTMDLYSHAFPTTKTKEMELIAKAFQGPGNWHFSHPPCTRIAVSPHNQRQQKAPRKY